MLSIETIRVEMVCVGSIFGERLYRDFQDNEIDLEVEYKKRMEGAMFGAGRRAEDLKQFEFLKDEAVAVLVIEKIESGKSRSASKRLMVLALLAAHQNYFVAMEKILSYKTYKPNDGTVKYATKDLTKMHHWMPTTLLLQRAPLRLLALYERFTHPSPVSLDTLRAFLTYMSEGQSQAGVREIDDDFAIPLLKRSLGVYRVEAAETIISRLLLKAHYKKLPSVVEFIIKHESVFNEFGGFQGVATPGAAGTLQVDPETGKLRLGVLQTPHGSLRDAVTASIEGLAGNKTNSALAVRFYKKASANYQPHPNTYPGSVLVLFGGDFQSSSVDNTLWRLRHVMLLYLECVNDIFSAGLGPFLRRAGGT